MSDHKAKCLAEILPAPVAVDLGFSPFASSRGCTEGIERRVLIPGEIALQYEEPESKAWCGRFGEPLILEECSEMLWVLLQFCFEFSDDLKLALGLLLWSGHSNGCRDIG